MERIHSVSQDCVPEFKQLTWYNHEDVLFEAHKDVVLQDCKEKERVTQAEKGIQEQHKLKRILYSDKNIKKECSTHKAGAFEFWLPLVLK